MKLFPVEFAEVSSSRDGWCGGDLEQSSEQEVGVKMENNCSENLTLVRKFGDPGISD